MESGKQKEMNKENKAHRYREHTGDCQRGGVRGGLGTVGDPEAPTSGHKIGKSQGQDVHPGYYDQ